MYLFLFYLPVVNSYLQPVVNSDFAIDNRLSIATSIILLVGADDTDSNCTCHNLFLMNGCVLTCFYPGKITKK